jgi:ABC-2 type transport system ATP-binding protein
MESMIQTHELTKQYGSIKALDEVTINVKTGTMLGFLGPNGSGKTTTIRLLLGLIKPSSGEAFVHGYNVEKEPEKIRELSGALLEHNGLYERLTAEDNLDFYGRVWKLDRLERKERIRELLEKFGLWERRKDYVISWSKGMKQRLAISRTLLHKPNLIFLDEPTSGLDPIAASSLRNDLKALIKDDGVTVFLTTHNLVEAERICDEVVLINKGKVLVKGSPEEIKKSSASLEDLFISLMEVGAQ